MYELTQALLEVLEGGARGALATVVRSSGSAPQRPGARLLLRPDGTQVGTVGGGAVEAAVLDALARCIETGEGGLETFDLASLGMCCGGRMEVFVEAVEGPPRLLLFGAGHVAAPTARVAREAGFSVTVIDERAELNTEARFPGCHRRLETPADAAAALRTTEADSVLVMTHDHRLDEEAFELFVRRPHRYLGLIGSRRKVLRLLRRVHLRSGLPPLDRVYAPVGLDLGAVTPGEIAVSIVAELVALRRGRVAPHLRITGHPVMQRILDGDLLPEGLLASGDG
ncbi:MAG: xanthine dehydrogenase accessory protein XdhC [Deltaproteobacteria bacterium]|nr:MAG: xanthine dehydrogenase accessory protein XdhC [Deltaproteobacteria bacterium]